MKSYLSYFKLVSSFVLCSLLITISCTDESDNTFNTDVAVNSSIIRVADTLGRTRILVYADKNWSANIEDTDATWATIENGNGTGQGYFFVNFESNKGQLPRMTNISVKGGGRSDIINFQQSGIATTINIKDDTIRSIAAGGKMKSGILCNMPYNLLTLDISYLTEENRDWISEVNVENNSLTFRLSKNTDTSKRESSLKLSYLDALGVLNRDSIFITQQPSRNDESDDAVEQSFAYIKSSLNEGVITENIFIEGIVISEKGNPNVATNKNKDYANIDPTENQITVYIQDPNGIDGGILIKTKSTGDNIFDRYERVKLWLKGAELVKYSNPSRFIIQNVETNHILEKSEADPIPPKELYIKDLTDNDIYTYVKLKDVEIAVPWGAFSNINEGYSKRMSVYPTCIRDINRDNIYMLINMDVPYRRDGTRVPQGSGTLSGIIVHDNLPRYGGDIGKYSIRPLAREEINLAENRGEGFTKIIAEWGGFGTDAPESPTIGREYNAKFYHSSASIASGPDFNGLTISAPTINNGGYSVAGWWNNNKGESWIFELTTLGITKPMSMQLEGDVIYGGPRNHILEWSLDKDAIVWNEIAEYTWQDLVRAGTETLLTQVAGHKVVDFALPDEIQDKTIVYIRSRVKNNEAGTIASDRGGTILATSACRLGHVSIKQNK